MKNFRIIVTLIGLALTGQTNAATIGFDCISNNNTESCVLGEAQLSIEALDDGFGGVNLSLYNVDSGLTVDGVDPNPSVTEIYFDTTLFVLSDLSIAGGSGVSFTLAQTLLDPSDLPGGGIAFSADFGAEADGSTSAGIQEGDWLILNIAGLSLLSLQSGLTSGALDIGLHVRGFNNFSESFTSVVPIPAAVWLFGTALIGLGGFSKRSKAV